jgi:hypothetical protein
MIKITIYILLAVNCIAAIMTMKNIKKYVDIANRMTITSILVASVLISVPYVLQLPIVLKG